MRKIGFILLSLAAILFLIGFIPDRSENVQFHYPGEELVQKINTFYSDIPIFANGEDSMEYIQSNDLVVDVQIPKSVLKGRRSHVEMTARLIPHDGTNQSVTVPDGFKLQIKSHLDFPRQFVEPAGFNSKPISDQVSPAFHWNLLTDKSEPLNGKMWIYLVLQNSQGLTIEYPLLGRDIAISIATFLGMTLESSRFISLCLAIPGLAILLFDKFMGRKKHQKKLDMIK